jgi:hypothetical protein
MVRLWSAGCFWKSEAASCTALLPTCFERQLGGILPNWRSDFLCCNTNVPFTTWLDLLHLLAGFSDPYCCVRVSSASDGEIKIKDMKNAELVAILSTNILIALGRKSVTGTGP